MVYSTKKINVYVFSRDELNEQIISLYFPEGTIFKIDENVYKLIYLTMGVELEVELHEFDRIVVYPVGEIAIISKDIVNDHFELITNNS